MIALTPEVAAAVPYLRKTDMQLASKMRFISAQFLAMFADDLWLRNSLIVDGEKLKARVEVKVRSKDEPVVKDYELPFSF